MMASDPFLSVSPLCFPLGRPHFQVAFGYQLINLTKKAHPFLPLVPEKLLGLPSFTQLWSCARRTAIAVGEGADGA